MNGHSLKKLNGLTHQSIFIIASPPMLAKALIVTTVCTPMQLAYLGNTCFSIGKKRGYTQSCCFLGCLILVKWTVTHTSWLYMETKASKTLSINVPTIV